MLVRLLKLVLLMIMGGLLLTACEQPPTPIVLSEAEATQRALPAASATPAIPATAESLHLVVGGWRGLDPVRFGDVASRQVQALLYEPLLTYDKSGALQPLLTEALPVLGADGLSWTVTLRSGVVFHDGTPVDGGQVAASLGSILEAVYDDTMPVEVFIFQQAVTALDALDMTVTFHLREPFASFPYLLASPALAVIHEGGVGTGPFILQGDLVGDGSLQFVPNSAYHGGSPSAAGVTVIILDGVDDPFTAVPDGDLFVGVGDIVPPPAGFVAVNSLPRRSWLLLDTTVSPFDRAAVQQAFAASLDDPAASFELFANAQLPDGFDLVLWNMLSAEAAEAVQARFVAGPVNLMVQPPAWDRLAQGDIAGEDAPRAYLLAWDADWIGQWWTDWLSGSNDGTVDGTVSMVGLLLGAESTIIYRREALTGLGMAADGLPHITAQTSMPPQSTGATP